MAISTWNFSLSLPAQEETRELIDLPTDFYLQVTFTPTMPQGSPEPSVTMVLERLSDPKETHTLWAGQPPYYGYAKKVTVTAKRPETISPPQNPVTGTVQITFQTGPF
jgi:hypothetical protein